MIDGLGIIAVMIFIAGFLIGLIVGKVSSVPAYTEPITPEIELFINDNNQVDTLYIYRKP